jgi:hypothetical protein
MCVFAYVCVCTLVSLSFGRYSLWQCAVTSTEHYACQCDSHIKTDNCSSKVLLIVPSQIATATDFTIVQTTLHAAAIQVC